MAEWHLRCKYPGCKIHLRVPLPRYFSPENIQEMINLHLAGETYAEIARQFDTRGGVVWQIIKDTLSGKPRRQFSEW